MEGALSEDIIRVIRPKTSSTKTLDEIADECMGVIAGETVIGENFYKTCEKVAAIILERAANKLAEEEIYKPVSMTKPASMTNPITGNTIHFDYAKIEEIDAKYENGIPEEELTAINEFKARIKKFYEEDDEV